MVNESLKEVLKEAAESPADRAKRRIMDAYDRGGATEVISATKKRILMTQDPAKLQGIMVAIREIIHNNEITLSQWEQDQLTNLFISLGSAQLGGRAKPKKRQ